MLVQSIISPLAVFFLSIYTLFRVYCFFKETSKQTRTFQALLPLEFLLVEEMPQTPPTQPPTVSTTLNVTVCICGLPTLLKALQLSMMSLPPWLSHMFLECSLETERDGNGDRCFSYLCRPKEFYFFETDLYYQIFHPSER